MTAPAAKLFDRPIELREYERRLVPPEGLTAEDAEALWSRHGHQVAVEFPTPRTEGRYALTAQGWAGFLPVTRTLALRLRPKVPLQNIFRMLEVAYDLKSFRLLPGLADCRSLEEFYERLANVLARRVLARSRRGFYREYVGHQDRLPAVRGRIDVARAIRAPWHPRLDCHFEEHTADVDDNRILLWTLDRIRRSGACRRPEVRQTVRTAFGRLQGLATPRPFTPADCQGRVYNRLNDDYQALHALCRFFLEHTGPTHEAGGHRSLPFLVDMAGLFERFVALWLREHLPARLTVTDQESVPLGADGRLAFQVDLVLYDRPGGTPLAVLDTKYKAHPQPSTDDVAQVVAYAEAKGCREAILLYPIQLERPLEVQVGGIRVRAVGFELRGDLDEAGRDVLERVAGTASPVDN